METDKHGPKVKLPPPLVFLAIMALAYGMELWLPLGFTPSQTLRIAGGIMLLIATGVLMHILLMFKRRKTAIEPWKPTSVIITSGYYRVSRNPIYLAFCCFPIGLGCILGSTWLILSLFPACTALYFVAIRAEEAYLLAKFPREYGAYLKRVRRWL